MAEAFKNESTNIESSQEQSWDILEWLKNDLKSQIQDELLLGYALKDLWKIDNKDIDEVNTFKSNINTLDIIVTDKFKNKINFNDIKTSDIIELYYIGFTQSKQFYKWYYLKIILLIFKTINKFCTITCKFYISLLF